MGGSVFTAGPDPLYTPRMPPVVYLAVRERCNTALRELFDCVATPIDGPAKKDFGDVDILVTRPKPALYHACGSAEPSLEKSMMAIEAAIGAERAIVNKSQAASHMALPWPSDVESPGSDSEGSRRFIQVDIRICDTLENFQWMLFKHAHGDIWNILGSTIRPYGLTVDEVGLYIRIPEVEKFERRRAKVFLTSEPSEILSFLGLPIEGYWDQVFDSLDDMYEYTSGCRMFWVKPASEDSSDVDGGNRGADADRKKLKSNDRRRMNTRPGFRKWIDEFLPRCREEGRFLGEQTTRDKITDEALTRFNAGETYTKQRDDFIRQKQRDMVLKDVIKTCLPEELDGEGVDKAAQDKHRQYRGCLIMALKQIILEGNYGLGLVPEMPLKGDNGFFILENIYDFLARHQDEVGRLALGQNNVRFIESKKKKELKRKAQLGEDGFSTTGSTVHRNGSEPL